MKKKIFIFFLLFSLFPIIANSDINPHCKNNINQTSSKDLDYLKIENIFVKVNNYRKWTKNGIRIITNNSRFTPNKYKQRFNAKITVTYENNIKCTFKGRIRHSGDAKDHISLHGNTILQSLDIHLRDGHIKGINKFKLYLPGTRGNVTDEIIQTEILRELGYIAPRTAKVNVVVNEAQSEMMFQEKAEKELLEYNNRREGPILEADQKFFFKLVANIPDNQLSNWSVGIPKLRNMSIKAMLAKQSNPEIILKNEENEIMSYEALNKLNLIYLYYTNRFQDEKNNFNYFDYDLDNSLLGLFVPEHILKLDMYNLLMQATNSQHGLSASNRKFYWNPIKNFFEPITYDSNININELMPTTTTVTFRLPISSQFYKAFDVLEKKLSNLDLSKIHNNLKHSGISLSKDNLSRKINKIISSLNTIQKTYLNIDAELVNHNQFKLIDDNILNRFNDTLKEINPNVYLVKHNPDNGRFQRCKIYLKMCEDYYFSSNSLLNLLEGELILDKKEYQYLGKSLDFKNINATMEN